MLVSETATLESWMVQFRKGLVEMCVLSAVASAGEAYGYQVLQGLSGVKGLELGESTVYPVLSRLSRQGLLSVRSGQSPNGPPRRYYRLTPLGMQRRAEMQKVWVDVSQSLHEIVTAQAAFDPAESPVE
jgi:PadR family transcriptional regulator, regulatory protein PadR